MTDGRDDDDVGGLHDQPAGKPYPSWDEMMSRLRRERTDQGVLPGEETARPEWHELVADMILGR